MDQDDDAEMLAFLLSLFQLRSPRMDGEHDWYFQFSAWPMMYCKGPSAREAVGRAMDEAKRSGWTMDKGV